MINRISQKSFNKYYQPEYYNICFVDIAYSSSYKQIHMFLNIYVWWIIRNPHTHTQIFQVPSTVDPPLTHTPVPHYPRSGVWRQASLWFSQEVRTFLRSPPQHAGHWRSVFAWEWVSDGIWASDRSQSPLFCPQSWFCHRSVKLTVLGQGQRWSGTRHVFRFKGIESFTCHHHLLTRMSLQTSMTFFLLWNTKGNALKKIEGVFFSCSEII